MSKIDFLIYTTSYYLIIVFPLLIAFQHFEETAVYKIEAHLLKTLLSLLTIFLNKEDKMDGD